MKKWLLVLLAIFFFQPQARAGALLEPYAGYQSMLTSYTFGSGAGILDGSQFKIDGSGVGFGARVGWEMSRLFVAADYNQASVKSSVKEQPAGLSVTVTDSTHTALGAAVGLDLMMVRPYLVYVFDDQLKFSTGSVLGTGFRLGVGFNLIPKLVLNLEYQSLTYTKAKDSAGVETTFGDSSTYKTYTSAGFFAYLSVPLTF